MTEYVRSMKFTLTVDTNKQTVEYTGDSWDQLREALREAEDSGLTPQSFAPALPVVREEDVEELGAELDIQNQTDENVPLTLRPDTARRIYAILEALTTRQGGAK